MVKKEKDDCSHKRRRTNLLSQLPLTGITGLLLLAMVTVLIPACQALTASVGQEGTLPNNRLPAGLRG
ncbi:MAG: hypothetical protein ACFE0K_07895 [Alcanivorax sp.]|uniref:hypothetical protein n=1 Tax=Alcanivorax sp. TaxID=1872427 RepID=UPI003DA7786A